jgi:Leu/Phe-tRNA-protein transferase
VVAPYIPLTKGHHEEKHFSHPIDTKGQSRLVARDIKTLIESLIIIYPIGLSIAFRDNKDSLWWAPSKKGVFKVKFFFYSLTSTGGRRFPWKSV